MTGLCGWTGAEDAQDDARERLARMLDRIPAIEGARQANAHAGGCALGLHAREASGAMATDGGLLVAIAGSPGWREDEFSRMAAELGATRALAEAYRREGARCLEKLRGAWALALIDPARRRALLAIDRMGIAALCWAQRAGTLVFGTTADSVASHPQIGAEISDQAIFDYLYCHMVPSPGTIYRGVSKLLPGQYLWFEDGRVEARFHWALEYEDRSRAHFGALAREFRELLERGVSRCLGGEPAGAFLSGGTDSSTVTGVLGRLSGRPADTYSIGFEAEGFDEMEYARITARHFGAKAHEYYVTPQDVAEAIPRIAAAYDEPFGNASAVPTYYCAKAAREDGKAVMLAGDGGDEIFGGNERYAKQKLFEAYRAIPGALRTGLIEPIALGVPAFGRVPALRKLASYIRQARIPLPDRLETYNFLEREALAEILAPEFLREIDTGEPAAIAREVYARSLSQAPVNRMMHLDLKQTLADSDLRKVSRMCMLAGVEVRYPLLDEDLVEFSGRLPPSYKVRGVKLRWFFKEALRDFLPPETITKSKHGFGLPFGLWLESHPALTELARESLASLRRRGILREAWIDRIAELHRSEHATYYGVMIWVLMMLEQWMQAHRA
ncbi:MAG: asparagine synthase (glutamine-hydrolyzing) [Rhodocyclaceae bacterium]